MQSSGLITMNAISPADRELPLDKFQHNMKHTTPLRKSKQSSPSPVRLSDNNDFKNLERTVNNVEKDLDVNQNEM